MKKKIFEVLSIIGRSLKGKVRYVILLLFLLILYGVWWYLQENVFIDIPEAVEEYCEDKYGGEFTWESFDLEQSGVSSKMSIVSDGETRFHVYRYYDVDDNLGYTDDYLSHKYEDDLNKLILGYLPEGSSGSILVEETTLNYSKDGSISVGGLLENPDNTLVMSVRSDHLWSLQEAENFSENFSCGISVFMFANGETSHFISSDGTVLFR